MSVCVHVCASQMVSPSLFAGDTPPVYTAPANAILVVGPCLWVLLGGCAHENRPSTCIVPFSGGHAQFFKMLQFFAWSEVGGVSPCVGMSVHVFV